MNSVKYYMGLILNIAVPIITVLLLFCVLPRIFRVFLPFIFAYGVALVANPLVLFLQRKLSIKRNHSSFFIIVGVLAIVVLVLYAVISAILQLCYSFAQNLPQLYGELSQTVRSLFRSQEDLFRHLPPDVLDELLSLTDNFNQTVTNLVTKLASPTFSIAGGAVKSVPSLFINVVIFILAAFCFISEWTNIQDFLRRHMPNALSGFGGYIRQELKKIFGTWLLAQFKIMFVVFAVIWIGLLVMQVKNSLWLSLLTAFLDFLPAFGVGFIFWPWIVMALLQGRFMFALGLTAIYILTQAVRQILQPKIMGDTMGLPPLWTLLFLYLGFYFYGIAGMLFSVPIGMLFLSAYRYGLFTPMFRSIGELTEQVSRIMKETMKRK